LRALHAAIVACRHLWKKWKNRRKKWKFEWFISSSNLRDCVDWNGQLWKMFVIWKKLWRLNRRTGPCFASACSGTGIWFWWVNSACMHACVDSRWTWPLRHMLPGKASSREPEPFIDHSWAKRCAKKWTLFFFLPFLIEKCYYLPTSVSFEFGLAPNGPTYGDGTLYTPLYSMNIRSNIRDYSSWGLGAGAAGQWVGWRCARTLHEHARKLYIPEQVPAMVMQSQSAPTDIHDTSVVESHGELEITRFRCKSAGPSIRYLIRVTKDIGALHITVVSMVMKNQLE
jgi:hypothetical protein